MYYKLCSRFDVEVLIEEIEPLLISQGADAEKVVADMREYAGVMEDNYGKDGSGGYIYFFCAPKYLCSVKEKLLKEYFLSDDMAEFRDIVDAVKPDGWRYVFELYIINTDYNMVLIYPEGGE